MVNLVVTWLAAVSLVMGAACAPQVSDEVAVYALVFGGEDEDPSPTRQIRLILEDATIPLSSARASPARLKEFEDMPTALRTAVSKAVSTGGKKLDAARFPPGTTLVPKQEIEAGFERSSLEDGYALLERRYGVRGWAAVSEVIVSDNRTDALVYVEMHCGELCGAGHYVWLHRDSPQSPFSFVKKVMTWVS